LLPVTPASVFSRSRVDRASRSTDGQSAAAQVAALRAVGAGKVFWEVASGAKTDRAASQGDTLQAGDVLMVTRLGVPRGHWRRPVDEIGQREARVGHEHGTDSNYRCSRRCSPPVRGTAVPIGRTAQASVLGVPNERFFPLYGTDPQLRAVYIDLTPDRVLLERGFTAALFDDAMTDNSPLFKTISGYLNEAMLAALAKSYDDGRLLLIGTSDLDAQQPVMWNIGAIAKSGHPRALDTIRRILLASAAIPGAFPPTMFDVTLDGVAYQEMHVDGVAFAQAFLYPARVTRQRRARMAGGQLVVPATAPSVS